MNTSIQTRTAAFVASIFATFGAFDLIANHAFQVAPVVILASAAR